jgi:hypothetical protein
VEKHPDASRTARGRVWLPALTAALALAGSGALAPEPSAAEKAQGEYSVKAAFLLNFATLVHWPPSSFRSASSPLALAILGPRDFADGIEEFFEGKKVDTRPVEVMRISEPRDLECCHVVFVSASERNSYPEILGVARRARVLSVGETRDFARRGGIIGFYREGARIRFAINRPAAEAAGLRISSRLLSLARLVSSGDE